MTRFFLTVSIAILLGSFALPARAQDEPVTADEMGSRASQAMKDLLPQDRTNTVFLHALSSTYENNPALKAARAETRAVFERLPQAEAGWRPRVSMNANVSAADGSVEPDMGADGSYLTRGASLNLNQPLYRGGRTSADTEAARNVIRAQLARLDRTEQLVLFDAITAYLDVLQNEALLTLATNNRAVISRQLDATRKRFDVGELTRTDVAQAEARLARAESGVITAQAALRSSRAEFVRVIGYPPENLGFPLPDMDIPETLDEAIGYAESWNPNVRAAQYAHRAAESDIDSQYGSLLPEISLSGDLSKSYEPTSSIDKSDGATIGVVASIPLYEAGAVRSRVRQSKKTAQQRYAEILDAKRNAREQTIAAWENLQAARGEVTSRMSQVEASEVARFGVKQEADLGARTILDTLDADQEVLDAQVALVTASRNEVSAVYSLAAALGVLTPRTLGFGDKVPDYNREIEAVRTNLFGTDVDSR